MGKIMGKLKHNYDAFPELQTKFLHIFKISGTILEQLAMRKKVTTRGMSH